MASGEAVARKDGRPLNALAAGDCFGEIGYLTRGKRTADVVAQTEVLLIKVKASMLDRASRDCQLLFYRRFLHTTIERLVRISDDYTIGGD
jgi:CRP-like cAMP-binding protein